MLQTQGTHLSVFSSEVWTIDNEVDIATLAVVDFVMHQDKVHIISVVHHKVQHVLFEHLKSSIGRVEVGTVVRVKEGASCYVCAVVL